MIFLSGLDYDIGRVAGRQPSINNPPVGGWKGLRYGQIKTGAKKRSAAGKGHGPLELTSAEL